MKPNANEVPFKDVYYRRPNMGNVGDVAELTQGPTNTVAEDYGQKSSKTFAPARLDK